MKMQGRAVFGSRLSNLDSQSAVVLSVRRPDDGDDSAKEGTIRERSQLQVCWQGVYVNLGCV